MTPEEHIGEAEALLKAYSIYTTYEAYLANATKALAHIELAKWKKRYSDDDS